MKNIIFSFIAIIALFLTSAVQAQVEAVSSSSSDAAQDVFPATVTVIVTENASSDTAQDSASGVNSEPSADLAQDGKSGVVSDPSTDIEQDGPIVTPPPVIPEGNPSSSSSGGSSRGSSSGSNNLVAFTGINPMVLGATTTSCPLITDYLKFGGSNDPIQVTKLQIFLNASEKAGISVNGTFDQKTEDAVKDFQKKYMTDILGPWDATRATGFVFITTQNKINQLACSEPISLTAEEVAIINAFKARAAGEDGYVQAEVGSVDGSGNLGTNGIEIEANNDNTAATADASIFVRFWNFIKELFK